MTLHIFANIVTAFGTAANNRGETEGNATTLHKLVWLGRPHTSVSAESIRFALRRRLADVQGQKVNRTWNEDERRNDWADPTFQDKKKQPDKGYIDDDLLGYMSAKAASGENTKGSADVRRAVLEVTRAISLTPWPGDVVFNAASPRATGSAAKGDGDNPVPYAAEVHATRYQYGLALIPDRLNDLSRAAIALRGISQLGPVAGNHGRFLFDFSPASIVLRITNDPAPRLLYCFETSDDGRTVDAPDLLQRVQWGDIDPRELVLGGEVVNSIAGKELRSAGAWAGAQDNGSAGVKAAVEEACDRIAATQARKEA
jgi:CRISPR-associated protein Cst2